MHHIVSIRDIDQLLTESVAVLYKHSPTCGICTAAAAEVEQFCRERPDAHVYQVDVLAARPLSREIATRTGIMHESPQAIVLRGGTPFWHASHYAVKAAALTAQYEAARASAPVPPPLE